MLSEPIIRKIADCDTGLNEFEKKVSASKDTNVKKIIMDFPTVYIHNWEKTGQYEVYVGESNNIFKRTREHFHNRVSNETWQKRIGKDASLYIIGHEHFNKSLTLDIENRLMHYLMSVNCVKHVHNGRGNPQGNYYPRAEFDEIFQKVWDELHRTDSNLFPSEQEVRDSAIYKASPLHKLTQEQEEAKNKIVERVELAMSQKDKQIVFIDGEAGTGKTVLNSSTFYELFCRAEKSGKKFNSYMIVNHDEQVKVYQDIYRKLGIEDSCGEIVSKATRFLNKYPNDDSVDVVFIDEAHLLFTQGNLGYGGNNQLDDIVKRAKVTVIVFDENQILRMDQYWEGEKLHTYRKKAQEQDNYVTLTKQLRIQADEDTLRWIDDFTKNQIITKIPHGDYQITICDSPRILENEIINKAKSEKTKLSRIIATYDWAYNKNERPKDHLKKYWEVVVEEWHKPWNYELENELSSQQKREIKHQAWAEQEHTIQEIGSTYTIQGFDLNYAGVILGESVKYENGKIIFDISESENDKVKNKRTLSDGTMQNFGELLLKHELRVLMTRGVNGIFIYACNQELREALKNAAK